MLQHGLEQLPMMPQLGGEQVSSLLRSSLPTPGADRASHDLPHTVPMEPLLHGLDDHGDYQVMKSTETAFNAATVQSTWVAFDDAYL